MLPLSRWMIDQQQAERFDLDHPERLDRLERVPAWARPPRRTAGRGSFVALAGDMRTRIRTWANRGSLGPLPNQCAGDPAGPRW